MTEAIRTRGSSLFVSVVTSMPTGRTTSLRRGRDDAASAVSWRWMGLEYDGRGTIRPGDSVGDEGVMAVGSEVCRGLVVIISMVPASCLLPNKQRTLSHHVWGPAALELRQAAYWCGKEAMADENRDPVEGPVRLCCTIAWPQGRRRCDFQAAVHALKPVVDGLEDANWFVDDKQVVAMEVAQVRSTDESGWVRVELERIG